MLKLVPFNATWISHDKIDVHAIYRRPRFKEDEYGELKREYDANGVMTWDLTSGLPVKQHTKWEAKGFQYVTLADRNSLVMAARFGTLMGGTMRDYDQHQTGGPWNYRKYAEGQQAVESDEAAQIRSDIDRFGPETAEELRRRADPDFRLPDALRQPDAKKPEKGKKAEGTA